MKFGRKLSDATYPKFRHHYLAYKDLKHAIKLITGEVLPVGVVQELSVNFGQIAALEGSVYRTTESRFQELLNLELSKVDGFACVEYEAIFTGARSLARDCDKALEEKRGARVWEDLGGKVEKLAEEIEAFDEFIRLNATGFRKICKKYDKCSRSASSPWFLQSVKKAQFTNLDLEKLQACLGAVWALWRRGAKMCGLLEEEGEAEGRGLPTTRRLFWIEPQDVCKVKNQLLRRFSPEVSWNSSSVEQQAEALLAQNVNAYELPRALREKTGVGGRTKSPLVLSAPSRSVFFENLQGEEAFSQYRLRTEPSRAQMSSLFHISFSPDEGQVSIIPALGIEKENDFARSRSASVKKLDKIQKVPFAKSSSKPPLIKMKVQEWVKIQENPEKIHEFLKEKRGSISGEQEELLLQILKTLSEHQLSPAVEVSSRRLAFHDSSRQIHVIMDEKVIFKKCEGGGNSFSTFPFAILKIFSSDTALPPFLEKILSSGRASEIHGFSIGVHAIAALFVCPLLLQQKTLLKLPHWFKHAAGSSFEDVSKMGKEMFLDERRGVSPMTVDNSELKVDILTGCSGMARQLQHEQAAVDSERLVSQGGRDAKHFRVEQGRGSAGNGAGKNPLSPAAESALTEPLLSSQRFHDEDPPPMRSIVSILSTFWHGCLDNLFCDSIGSSEKVKIEPKTFLANERTFLDWVYVGFLILTVSLSLMHLSDSKASKLAGAVFAPLGVLTLVFALLQLRKRIELLKSKEPINYGNTLFPSILGVAMFTSLSSVFVVHVYHKVDELRGKPFA